MREFFFIAASVGVAMLVPGVILSGNKKFRGLRMLGRAVAAVSIIVSIVAAGFSIRLGAWGLVLFSLCIVAMIPGVFFANSDRILGAYASMYAAIGTSVVWTAFVGFLAWAHTGEMIMALLGAVLLFWGVGWAISGRPVPARFLGWAAIGMWLAFAGLTAFWVFSSE